MPRPRHDPSGQRSDTVLSLRLPAASVTAADRCAGECHQTRAQWAADAIRAAIERHPSSKPAQPSTKRPSIGTVASTKPAASTKPGHTHTKAKSLAGGTIYECKCGARIGKDGEWSE